MHNHIAMYQSGEIELDISIQEETIWLTQKQIVELLDSSKANISEHIKAIFDSNELQRSTTVRKFRTVQSEGGREVTLYTRNISKQLKLDLKKYAKNAYCKF